MASLENERPWPNMFILNIVMPFLVNIKLLPHSIQLIQILLVIKEVINRMQVIMSSYLVVDVKLIQ